MLRRLLREPLVHFLLLGGALFAIFGHGGTDAGGMARMRPSSRPHSAGSQNIAPRAPVVDGSG